MATTMGQKKPKVNANSGNCVDINKTIAGINRTLQNEMREIKRKLYRVNRLQKLLQAAQRSHKSDPQRISRLNDMLNKDISLLETLVEALERKHTNLVMLIKSDIPEQRQGNFDKIINNFKNYFDAAKHQFDVLKTISQAPAAPKEKPFLTQNELRKLAGQSWTVGVKIAEEAAKRHHVKNPGQAARHALIEAKSELLSKQRGEKQTSPRSPKR